MSKQPSDSWNEPIDISALKIGDIVTLKTGHRGKAVDFNSDGEFTLLSGRGKRFTCFYPSDVVRIDRQRRQNIRIYQIDIASDFAFMDFKWLRSYGRATPLAELYDMVYDDQLEIESLEDVFRIFNAEHPQGFTGRSLSVSDIVELYDTRSSRFFFCDSIGFKRIRFKPVKFNYALFAFSERDSFEPKVFSSYDKAFLQMRQELKAQIGGFNEDGCSNNEYGFDIAAAWSNYRGNHDWIIYRISEDRKGRMKLSDILAKKLVIWTYFSTPFAMGSKERLTGCEVSVVEKLNLGHGFFGYRVPMPNGDDVICEGCSGAIVGNSLDAVQEDINSGEADMMRRQVQKACLDQKQVKVINAEEFWDIYQRSVRRRT